MRSLLLVAWREIAERRLALAAAALGGLLPLGVPLLPMLGRHDPAAVRDVTALVLALAAAVVAAPLLGSVMMAQELAEGRMGFYFARPVRAAALWLGKVSGMGALLWASLLLVLLPATLAGGGLLHLRRLPDPTVLGLWTFGPWATALLLLAASMLFLLAGNVAGVALRSRSPWLLVDLGALTAVVWSGWAVSARLLGEGVESALVAAWVVLGIGLMAALLLAGGIGLNLGRIDLTRCHHFQSHTLWLSLAAMVLVFAGWAHWVLHPRPVDLAIVEDAVSAPEGPWVVVRASTRGRGGWEVGMMLDPGSGRYLRLAGSRALWNFAFTSDGSHAAWFEAIARERYLSGELVTVDLGAERPVAVPSGIVGPGFPVRLELSPDASRVAILGQRLLTILELPGGKILASARIPKGSAAEKLVFDGPDRVRLYSWRWEELGRPLEIYELQFGGGLELVGGAQDATFFGVLDRSGDRFLPRGQAQRELLLRDGRSGEPVAVLRRSDEPRWRCAKFLADGRIAAAEVAPEGARVHILSAEGEELELHPAPPAEKLWLSGEARPGRLVLRGTEGRGSRSETYLLDLETGRWWSLGEGLWLLSGVEAPRALFRTEGGALLQLAPNLTWRAVLPVETALPRPVREVVP